MLLQVPKSPTDYNRLMQSSVRVTKAEELELLRVAQGADSSRARAAETRLLNAHYKFIYKITLQFGLPGQDVFDDLFSAACIGFLEGIRRYDKFDEGLHLITYAVWWVRRYIVDTKYDDKVSFGGASNRYRRLKALKADAQAYVAAEKAVPPELTYKINELQAIVSGRMSSIDQRNDTGDLVREFEDRDALLCIRRDIDATATNTKVLTQLARTLTDRERFVLLSYYGIGLEGVDFNYGDLGEAVSAKFNPGSRPMSKERIRQIVHQALRKLQKRANLLGYTRLSFQAEGNL